MHLLPDSSTLGSFPMSKADILLRSTRGVDAGKSKKKKKTLEISYNIL